MAKTKEIIQSLAEHLEELDEFRVKHTLPDPESKEGIAREIAEVKKMKSIFAKDFKKITDSINDIKQGYQMGDSSINDVLENLQEELDEKFEEINSFTEEVSNLFSELEKENLTSAEMHKLGITNLGKEFQTKSDEIVSSFNSKYEETKQTLNKHKEESTLVFIEKDEIIDGKFLQLEKDLKKFAQGIYQYGSSFSISVNGTYIGTTSGVNFKAGTNVTITQTTDSQGIITVTFNSSGGGGGGINFETPKGTINGTNKAFSVDNTPKYIVSDGVTYFSGNGYTLFGLNITMDIAPVGFLQSAY